MNPSEYIILNSHRYSSEEIVCLSKQMKDNQDLPDWERELFIFLEEWFSDSDFVLARTSGSTGVPKPIALPKTMMRNSAGRTIDYFGLKKNDRLLLCLSCRFIAGKMMVVRAIVGQMNLITIDPSSDFDLLKHELFDFSAMVPNQVFKILEKATGKDDLHNVRNLLIGGSSISANLESQIAPFHSRIVLTYGMTETASHIAIRELSGDRKSNRYSCLPGIHVNLSEAGTLQVYLPELNEPLQTNDIAELQSDTSFQILGRADSVIISGGIKYSPETIEKKLEMLIDSRFVISAISDEKLGEKLVLVIEGIPVDTEVLEQNIGLVLSAYETPKAIYFLKQFPETSSGKLKRDPIRQLICSR